MQKPRILYIDDETDLLELASSFFEDESLHLDTANSISDALEKIKNCKYDLIISDDRMPSGRGKDLLNVIRKEKVFCGKFILVTGNLNFQDEAEKSQYDLVLFKPLHFHDLVETVKKMLSI